MLSPEKFLCHRAAVCLLYLVVARGVEDVDDALYFAAQARPGDEAIGNEWLSRLEAYINNLTAEEKEKLIFNGHDRRARNTANWLEDYAGFKKRAELERKEQSLLSEIRAKIRSKLTPTELDFILKHGLRGEGDA